MTGEPASLGRGGTGPPVERRGAAALRRAATDPLVPGLVLAGGGVLAAVYGEVLTWAVLGGLAGYTLSGSV